MDIGRFDSQSDGDALPVGRVGLVEVPDLAELGLTADWAHMRYDVGDEPLLVVGLHQAKEIAWLGEVVVARILLVKPIGKSAELKAVALR